MIDIVLHDVEFYPQILIDRLGEGAPEELFMLGNRALLQARRTALLSSTHAPESAHRKLLETAGRLGEEGRTVISGFDTSLLQACLDILLTNRQPIIICPARAIETLRIPKACRAAFDAGRLLILSPFIMKPVQASRETAFRRSVMVAALADEALVAHVEPGGQTALIMDMLREWNVPLLSLNKTGGP